MFVYKSHQNCEISIYYVVGCNKIVLGKWIMFLLLHKEKVTNFRGILSRI